MIEIDDILFKQKLKEYLRENLEIRIDYDTGFYSPGTYEIELVLECETISRSVVEVQNRG